LESIFLKDITWNARYV